MDLDDKVFWWADQEREETSIQLVKARLIDLKDFYIREDQHTALFHKAGTNIALFRVRRYSDGKVVYRLIESYNALVKESPDLVNMLLRSGLYVYQRATKAKDSSLIELDFFR